MRKKLNYQIPAVHFMSSSDKMAKGYCHDGSGAAQLTSAKFCLSGFSPLPGAVICENGAANVTTYMQCDSGPSYTVYNACDGGNGDIG